MMEKETEKKQISKEAMFFRVTVFIAVVIGIIQFFNILYRSIHDVTPQPNNNTTEENNQSVDTAIEHTKFIQPVLPLTKPEKVFEHKKLKDQELIKPDTIQ